MKLNRTLKIHPIELKPFTFPDGFALLVDTREQQSLVSRVPKGLTVISATLPVGDYSVQGFVADDPDEVVRKLRLSGKIYPLFREEV